MIFLVDMVCAPSNGTLQKQMSAPSFIDNCKKHPSNEKKRRSNSTKSSSELDPGRLAEADAESQAVGWEDAPSSG